VPALLKIGLIGCGRAAELIYLPALKKFGDIEVTAVLDPSNQRRELLKKSFRNCFGYSSLDKSFIEKIDAAIVCSPPDTHISIASELLENNKYVLVEKPLALSLEGIGQLIKTELHSESSLMMGFNHRNWKPVINLKEKLLKSSKVISAEIIFSGNYNNWNPVSLRADPLNDLGPHVFDLIKFIFNKPLLSLSANLLDKNSFEIKIIMQENISLNCIIAHCANNEKSIKVETAAESFFVKLGSIRIEPQVSIKRNFLDSMDLLQNKILRKTSPIKESFEIQLNNFFHFVRQNKKAVPGIEDGISAIVAIEAAKRSINENGKEIFLNGIT
jgi:predicted dehydrogenase